MYKWIPLLHDKEVATSDQVVYIISCQGLCTHKEWLYPEFQFMATDFMSMAAKTSNRGNDMTEANLQADGLVEGPAQGTVDWWETEGEDSSPHNLPTWSPVQRLLTGHLNMNYCLEIQVTLTDELGDVPPPLHAFMAPVVEDMLWEARVGLTEAVVIGPGRAILFYGRHLRGEGLKADKARYCIPPYQCRDMGREIGLPHCQPHDITRRQKGHNLGCIGS